MREFAQTLSKFTEGLRKNSDMPRNSGFAVEAYNTRVGAAGLEVPPLIVYPISGAPTVSWPLPQLIKIRNLVTGGTDIFFLSSTNPQYLYQVNSDYTLTVINREGTATPLNLGAPGRYTVADFGIYQIWAKYGTDKKVLERYYDTTWLWRLRGGGELNTPNVLCVCAFRGQLIAGFLGYTETESVQSYVIAWSRIGEVNPTYIFTPPYIDLTTANQVDKGTSGNYRIGPNSVPYRILPLGKAVIVYCKDKVFAMIPIVEPVPTFAIVPIHSFGVAGTWLIDGDEFEHAYVDSSGRLWRMKADLKPELLDYREFMNTMTMANIVVSKNINYGDYYISDGTKCYLLTPYGLTQWFQYPTSIVYEDANKRLIGPISVSSDLSASIATDVLDFGVRALKTITVLEMGATGQVMTGNVDYKYKVTDAAFTASRLKTASNFGVITPIVSGTEFRLRVKGADYTKFDLDYLTVRYKYVDKRMIRGVYATDAKVLSRSGG